MKVFVVGGGGREYTILWALRKSSIVKELFIAPGNGGTSLFAENIPIKAEDITSLAEFAKEQDIDLTVVGPEVPIALGIRDEFEKRGLSIIAPTRKASFLEASKAEAKLFMQRHNIPSARFGIFDRVSPAVSFLEELTPPFVIKADGLAGGKGVAIAETKESAVETLREYIEGKRFGPAGSRVVVEEFLKGKELSVFIATDSIVWRYLGSAQDYKKLLDENRGPNTGGMGSISPVPFLREPMKERIEREIIEPTLKGLKNESLLYEGILYFGLIYTTEGPKVLEYNIRLGDPEAQVLLPRFEFDIMDMFLLIKEKKLSDFEIALSNKNAVCVVVAAKGYPGEYKKDIKIGHPEAFKDKLIFHAGTVIKDGIFYSSGGRVLNFVALGDTLETAREEVYRNLSEFKINGLPLKDSGFHYREDIGSNV